MGWDAYSAGIKPETQVNPFAINVMAEIGIDIAQHTPESISKYLDENFDIVATLCDNARETCPVFSGSSDHQIHHGFEDPADARGSDGEITEVYRRIRDEIRDWVKELTGGNL
jgi:arsenate reductase